MSITTFEELKKECLAQNKTIWQITQLEEAQISDMSVEEVRANVLKHIKIMKETIQTSLTSSEKAISEWCGDDCVKLVKRYQSHGAMFGKLFEKIVTYALGTSEENLRMGRIVACPTAGSCGIVPSVLVAYSEEYGLSEQEQINFLITSGKIGSIISNKVQLAGAVGGCQAECGVASAMCAGGLAQTMGGNIDEILNASTLAIKNLLGLTCDPVCGLVEVPCIKRNPILAIHAVTATELALAGIESKIPPDEVIDAMRQTGQLMSPLLKESSQAGLATTKTALKLKSKIFG
jgi:L-serine dehydratase